MAVSQVIIYECFMPYLSSPTFIAGKTFKAPFGGRGSTLGSPAQVPVVAKMQTS
jgi:hypothetical protein